MAEKEYIGTLKKCPGCGNALESLVARCPNCGLELTGTSINQTIAIFADKIADLETKRNTLQTWFVEKKSLLSKKLVLEEIPWDDLDNEKKQYIENFIVPNARADFLEFFIFAIVHIDPNPQTKYDTQWNDIWATKCKQVFTKARISMAGEPEALDYMKQLAKESGFSL